MDPYQQFSTDFRSENINEDQAIKDVGTALFDVFDENKDKLNEIQDDCGKLFVPLKELFTEYSKDRDQKSFIEKSGKMAFDQLEPNFLQGVNKAYAQLNEEQIER